MSIDDLIDKLIEQDDEDLGMDMDVREPEDESEKWKTLGSYIFDKVVDFDNIDVLEDEIGFDFGGEGLEAFGEEFKKRLQRAGMW